MSEVNEYKDFYAICNHEPEGERRIRVGGTVVFNKTGGAAELGPYKGSPPLVPELTTLLLTLALNPSEHGGAALDPVPLEEWSQKDPHVEYTKVKFFVSGTDDAAPSAQEVEHVQ
jgi:hypothetical protein